MSKAACGGWSMGLAVAVLAAAWSSQGFAERPAANPVEASSHLSVVSTTTGERTQQLMVLDPQLRVLSVYHVDLGTGEIVLKSVRNIRWDLQMTEFNAQTPLPREIRSLVEQR